jgi:cyclase
VPVLLIRNGQLVKTIGFQNEQYVGDPINAIRIFNDKEADELLVIDIDASMHSREPDFAALRVFASECRMPLSYAGGVQSIEQIERLIGLGIEKVGLSSAAISNPRLIGEAATRIGSQSIAVILDVRKIGDTYQIFTHNGTKKSELALESALEIFQSQGTGEIIVNSIDRDGTMEGFDRRLISAVMERTNVPVTAIGGAANMQDCTDLSREFGPMGVGVGSLFVFKGRFRAVLITYPSQAERSLMSHAP